MCLQVSRRVPVKSHIFVEMGFEDVVAQLQGFISVQWCLKPRQAECYPCMSSPEIDIYSG